MADDFYSDVFVGSDVGYLKAVDLNKDSFNNVMKPSKETADPKSDEICLMCWKNEDRNHMLVGLRDGIVKTYDVEQSSSIDQRDCDVKDSHFTGLFCYNRSSITCTESGMIRVWTENDPPLEVRVGNHISRMRYNRNSPNIIGTGGKENDLKLWDLEKSGQNIFKAKNVRNDNLDLRVPVWVTDLGFLPTAGLSKVVTGTAYHQIRLYDTAAKKRPMISIDFEDHPVTALCVTDQENTFIVGNAGGTMSIIDLRKGQAVGGYKGFAGSIRCIEHCEETSRVAVCGLDRFLRVYDCKSRNLLHKIYLKTRLNCLLFSNARSQNKDILSQDLKETVKENDNLRKRERTEDDDNDHDALWDSMEVVKTDSMKYKKKSKKDLTKKEKMKKKKS